MLLIRIGEIELFFSELMSDFDAKHQRILERSRDCLSVDVVLAIQGMLVLLPYVFRWMD